MSAPPIPSVRFSFPNKSLGQTPPSPSGIVAVIGPCTGPDLAINSPLTLGGDPQNVVATAGYGPAADLTANLVQGGATAVVVRADSTPATPGAVTKTGGGASVMTVTGTPFDRYIMVKVEVMRSGTPGDPTPPRIRVSLDNGSSFSGEYNLPSDGVFDAFAVSTGMTFNFTAAALAVGAVYSFSVPYPTVAVADLVAAARSLRQSTEAYSLIYIAAPLSRADAETVLAEIATFVPRKRFVRVFLESVDTNGSQTETQWMTALSQAFEGAASDLWVVSAGYAPVRSTVLGSLMWRSIGWLGAVRASLVAVSRDLGAREDGALCSFASSSTGGPVVTSQAFILPPGYFIHDESVNPGLNTDQFMTIMSDQGEAGYFITNPNIMSGPSSDYTLLQFGRISDEAARKTNQYFMRQLSNDVLLDSRGFVIEKVVKKWEDGNNDFNSALTTNQNVSSFATIVGREANVINNEPIPVSFKWQPKGYPKTFLVTIMMTRGAASAA